MGKKTNRSVKKRRIVVAPSSDLDEDMSSGEKETKDVKEGDNEQKPYLTLNGTNSDSEESNDAEDSDKELQVALKEGLLKSDKLNYIVEKKRPIINKVASFIVICELL
uniref:Uncharacterized protein n=1 Tax=Ascaris lumbricoides TaxID=6252 RepID=A0A0M3I4P9_ASCLU